MLFKKKRFDVISIGDIITDAFILLTDPRIHVKTRDGMQDREICIPYPEKVPFEEVYLTPAAGNVGNSSYSAAKLGLSSAVIASIGDDKNGQECLDTLKERGVSPDLVTTHKGKKTNYSYVLWFEQDRTILRKHEDFTYHFPDIGKPRLIYFSSISASAYPYHDTVAEYLEKNPEVKFAFQPGSPEIKLGTEKLERIYKRSDIFFCNVEEAEEILGVNDIDIKDLLKKMSALGPKIVVITNGPEGAYAFDGTDVWHQTPYPDPVPPVERTGAGDAFSSTTAIALTLGRDLGTALSWGAVNSMSVVQHVGGQKGLLTRTEIEEYLKKAPADFKTEKIS